MVNVISSRRQGVTEKRGRLRRPARRSALNRVLKNSGEAPLYRSVETLRHPKAEFFSKL
jgi:hypothetical protein